MNLSTMLIFVLGAVGPSLLITWSATFVVRRAVLRWGLVDPPGERKVHLAPTPLGGGLAIWLGVLIPFAVGQCVLWAARQNGWLSEGVASAMIPAFVQPHLPGLLEQLGGLWTILLGGTLLMAVGLLDDVRGLDWRIRLATQLAVAAWCVSWQGWRLSLFLDLPALMWLLSVAWIVLLVNSFNMLDNMDGASAGVAAIAAVMLAGVLLSPDPGTREPQLFVGGFLLVMVGAMLGFLWHNRPPAKIFMGDAGSYFVGFCLAVATLLATFASYQGPRRHAVLAPLCVMAVPLYDTITVLWIRLRAGRSPFRGDTSHFSHRLVQLGMSQRQAVLTLYLTTAVTGLGALLLRHVDFAGAKIVLLMVLGVLSLIGLLESAARQKQKA